MKVINLSKFKLSKRHFDLLQRGMSFSPTSQMDEFTVFKDVTLFIRKVFLRFIHTNSSGPMIAKDTTTSQDEEVLAILSSLLEENEREEAEHDPYKRQAGLNIKSTKMPPLNKNRWLCLFLDMIQTDLSRVNWKFKNKNEDNLSLAERKAIRELSEAPQLVIKRSDKGGNVVLLEGKKL